MALATCHHFGAWNFEATARFLEDLCNSVVVHSCLNCSLVNAHICHSITVITVVASILL